MAVSQAFLVFDNFDSLRSSIWVFCRMCLNLNLLMFFSWSDWDYGFGGITQQGMPFSWHGIRGTYNQDVLALMLILIPLSCFSVVKLFFLPFQCPTQVTKQSLYSRHGWEQRGVGELVKEEYLHKLSVVLYRKCLYFLIKLGISHIGNYWQTF